jgi:hypothetical protein
LHRAAQAALMTIFAFGLLFLLVLAILAWTAFRGEVVGRTRCDGTSIGSATKLAVLVKRSVNGGGVVIDLQIGSGLGSINAALNAGEARQLAELLDTAVSSQKS